MTRRAWSLLNLSQSILTPPKDLPGPPEPEKTLPWTSNTFRQRVTTAVLQRGARLVQNITKEEQKAISTLKENKDIIIKPADKGGAIVIMNTSDYKQEAYRQLSNTLHYAKLQEDPTDIYAKELLKLLKGLPSRIRDSVLQLIPEDPKVACFYMLPKVHKPGNPGRPIISGIGTLTENLSGWVEHILKPLVRGTPSFIQDTTHLLNRLSAIGPLPE
ncbi:uncharacterized protein PAF06_017613 [Gastrophryne carolinensis]